MPITQNPTIEAMQHLLTSQQQAYRADPMPSIKQRAGHLKRLKAALLKHHNELIEAVNSDFGCRSKDETAIAEVIPAINAIKFTISNLRQWMKPSKRHLSVVMKPAKAHVYYQPLGVIGIIVPWNYPIAMTLQPLICALGAGNRAMIKLSEFTPDTNAILQHILAEAFEPQQVAVVIGGAEVAAAFSALPFDHILFTGSTAIGRRVMQAAAKNLTPVTLELGGKSPTIIDDEIPLCDVVDRIVFGKCFNAGQTCVAPDYILCPTSRRDDLVALYRTTFKSMFPSMESNPDYTSIINTQQQQRLQSYLADATKKGATVIKLDSESPNPNTDTQKFAPHLVLNTTEDMKLIQQEIFGPILPIITYERFDEVIEYINQRPRPLALYLFSYDKAKQQRVLEQTHAGGVCFNETLIHAGVDSLPFGGIGDSGMGHYHGWEGFQTLSKAKPVFVKGRLNSAKLLFAPYGQLIHKIYYWLMLR